MLSTYVTLFVALLFTGNNNGADAFTSAVSISVSSRPSIAFASPAGSSSLQMAGFGGAGGGGKSASSKKKKDNTKNKNKLKPKRQWNQYLDMKDSKSIPVAVRANADDWLEVGAVKSKDNAHTEAAVIRHRVLISDHSRRMFPTQILPKDKLEFAFQQQQEEQGDDWVAVDNDGAKADMPDDVDRLIGFEGHAEPSGFYKHSTEKLSDMTVSNFGAMKNKGITGHVRPEVHD